MDNSNMPNNLYVLMNKNTPVCSLEISETGNIIKIVEHFNSSFAPFSTESNNNINVVKLNNWWTSRNLPLSRDDLDIGLSNLGFQNFEKTTSIFSLVSKSYGLSLSDQYWLKLKDTNTLWHDINFFENPFSEDIGKALFDNYTILSPNLISPDNSSDGQLKKKWKIIDGERYLLKSGSRPIIQQPYNEAIAYELCHHLGINHVVPYELMQSGKHNMYGQKEPISACPCFINTDTEYISAYYIMKYKEKDSHISHYDHYVDICKSLGINNIVERLDDMILVDYIMGNTDRHYGNFGLIRDVNTLEFIDTAPIFDTGNSLFYDVPTERLNLNSYGGINMDFLISKSFDNRQNKIIKRVKNLNKYDFSKLKNFSSIARKIFKKYDFIDQKRINELCNILDVRIQCLTREKNLER